MQAILVYYKLKFQDLTLSLLDRYFRTTKFRQNSNNQIRSSGIYGYADVICFVLKTTAKG